MQILTRIKNSFFAEQENWILWIPVFFGCGIIFYFYFPNNAYLFPLFLFLSAIFLIYLFKEQLLQLLIIALTIFLAGFLWAKFFTEKIAYTPKIEQKIYATAIGKVDDINSFYNSFLKRNSYQIILKDVALYKAGSLAGDVLVKKEKPKKIKKYKKKKAKIKKPRKKRTKKIATENIDDTQENQASVENNLETAVKNIEEKPKKKRGKRKKKIGEENINQEQNISESTILNNKQATGEDKARIKKPKKYKPKKPKKITKTIINNYLNVAGYQEIDREFLSIDYKSQNKHWLDNKYKNPPKKIALSVHTKLNDAKIGDIVQSRVVIEPFKPPYFSNGYDRGFENYFKGIGGNGYAASDLKILKARNENSFFDDIKILRQNIAKKILDQMDEKSGGTAVALLVGAQNLIKPDVMQAMRNSGLAHLISISGLHFTLAAGIFFFSIRFLLSLNQYLALHFDIKKIAAFLAIFAGLFYLILADAPIPAVRSFVVIALIFSAILFDLTPNAFRSTAFAALVILIFSPNAIFSVSFQLSFAAILALIVLADISKPIHINSSERPIYLKFFFYFLGIILSSLAATIATTPFSIYHFNNFIAYGSLANLIAIPIASFITMPCGFLALVLMPIGFEKFALYPMQISIGWIIDIANYVATIPNSYLTIKSICPTSFGLIILGGLWFLLWQQNWRLIGIVLIIIGIYLGYKSPLPDLLIDYDKKMVAFYDNDKLVFLKPVRNKQVMIWTRKMGLNQFTNINDLNDEEKQKFKIDCDKNLCQFFIHQKQVLVLQGRNRIDEICKKDYDLIININNKYQTPICFQDKK
jgi:competence protein ComEC